MFTPEQRLITAIATISWRVGGRQIESFFPPSNHLALVPPKSQTSKCRTFALTRRNPLASLANSARAHGENYFPPTNWRETLAYNLSLGVPN